MNQLTVEKIQAFEESLYLNEKSKATVNKYLRAVRKLAEYLSEEGLTKSRLLEYRKILQSQVKAQTVNGALSSINAFLDETRELSEAEYKQLLAAAQAKGNERLYLVMLTICGTGIRVSELQHITVEAAQTGRAEICMKGKNSTVLLQKELRARLLKYAKELGIDEGHIFRTRSGKPLDRTNICHDMKKLCASARVDSRKVFPHNLRHLFARSFYAIEKNLAHLADILGHSRIETTRIYVAASATAHERILNKMRLIL